MSSQFSIFSLYVSPKYGNPSPLTNSLALDKLPFFKTCFFFSLIQNLFLKTMFSMYSRVVIMGTRTTSVASGDTTNAIVFLFERIILSILISSTMICHDFLLILVFHHVTVFSADILPLKPKIDYETFSNKQA